jgi:hypothetical protein
MVACKQCADSSHRVIAVPEGAPDSEQCMSGAPRCQSSNNRNRQNPNDWVMWLAHRTVSGGAPDCLVRPSTDSLPNGWFGGWGYKYPPTTTTSSNPSFLDFTFNTKASAINTRHNSIESKPLQVPNQLQTNSD